MHRSRWKELWNDTTRRMSVWGGALTGGSREGMTEAQVFALYAP